MKQLTIPSWKYGLDSRKEDLTGQSGTLQRLEDCFVNSGGEIEKRKGFFSVGKVRISDSDGGFATFGLEVTTAGLVVFGSALAYGSTPAQGQATLLSEIVATGVTYQQLKHPSLTNDSTETYNAGRHKLTSIPFSTNYNGKAFVAATFSDGRTFLYYDGTLIQHSANGLVMSGRTDLADIANDLLRQVQAIEWNGEANVAGDSKAITSITRAALVATAVTDVPHGYSTSDVIEIIGALQPEYNGKKIITVVDTVTFTFTIVGAPATPATTITSLVAVKASVTQNGSVQVNSPTGDHFSVTIEEDSASGYAGVKSIAVDALSVAGTKAYTGFQIDVNSGTFTLTAPAQSTAATPTIDLCGGAVTALSTGTLSAAAIAAAVNDLTYAHGYSANSVGNIVQVFAPVSWGDFTFNLTVDVTTGTVSASAVTPTGPALTLAPSTLLVTRNAPLSQPASVTGSCTCTPAGGTAPYTFLWEEINPPSADTITILNPTSNTATFTKFMPVNTSYSRNFKVTVTDSSASSKVAVAFIPVTLRLLP